MQTTNINAVIVRLNISGFPNSRDDDAITADVKTLHKLQGKAGKWVKLKLPEEALSPAVKAGAAARKEHYRMTLPWVEGFRLLPMAEKASYEAMIAGEATKYAAAADAIAKDYEKVWIPKSREMHNGTWRQSDYPETAEGFRSLFKLRYEYSPVPCSDEFVKIASGHALSAMQAQLEAVNAQRIEEAMQNVWDRLLEPVAKMAETLRGDSTGFHETLVTNIGAIVDLVPSLNLIGDSKLKSAANEIKTKLAGLDVQMLKHTKQVRKSAAEVAGIIVKKFGVMGSRKFGASTK